MNTRSHFITLATALLLFSGLLGMRTAGVADDATPADPVSALQTQQQALETQLTTVKTQLHQALVEQYRTAQALNPAPITAMQFYLPHLKQAPVIDGVIDDKEWAGAIAVPISGDGCLIARPGAVFYLGWDGDSLYVAQRYPLLPFETPVRLNREPGHGNVDSGDTRVELFIDRNSNGSVPSPCRYQFVGNAVGNQWEREEQYAIGQNRLGWGGAWQYKQRVTPDGKYWEAEMAIPRKTLFQLDPLHDGEVCRLGLATDPMYNYPRSGFDGWSIPATLKDDTPEIRLAHPEKSLNGKRVAFDLSITNTTAAPFTAEVVARLMKVGAKADEPPVYEYKSPTPVTLDPDGHSDVNVDAGFITVEEHTPYTLAIMVLREGKSVYTWSTTVRYGDAGNTIGLDYHPDPNPWHAWCAYAPLSNFVKLGVDKYDLPNAGAVKKVRYRITPLSSSDLIANGEFGVFNYDRAETRVSLPDNLAAGSYKCTLTLLDDAGAGLGEQTTTFERKDNFKLRWLDNHIGDNDRVLKPFTPLSVQDGVIRGYAKTITLAGTGLPATITARGIRLLASPIYLRGQWHNEPFSVEGVRKAPIEGDLSETQVNYSARGTGGPLQVKTEYHLEYDGTAKITLHLTPLVKGGRAELDYLQLVIPFTQDGAGYMMVNGLDSRFANRVGPIPGAGTTGTVWTSRDVPGQQMTVGSFIPVVHVGNRSSGLTWFSDSDQGWWPSEKKPAIEMARTADGRIDLIFNLASEPVEFGGERVITFGLCTVPTRPSSDYKSPLCMPGFGLDQQTGKWDPRPARNASTRAST